MKRASVIVAIMLFMLGYVSGTVLRPSAQSATVPIFYHCKGKVWADFLTFQGSTTATVEMDCASPKVP